MTAAAPLPWYWNNKGPYSWLTAGSGDELAQTYGLTSNTPNFVTSGIYYASVSPGSTSRQTSAWLAVRNGIITYGAYCGVINTSLTPPVQNGVSMWMVQNGSGDITEVYCGNGLGPSTPTASTAVYLTLYKFI